MMQEKRKKGEKRGQHAAKEADEATGRLALMEGTAAAAAHG